MSSFKTTQVIANPDGISPLIIASQLAGSPAACRVVFFYSRPSGCRVRRLRNHPKRNRRLALGCTR